MFSFLSLPWSHPAFSCRLFSCPVLCLPFVYILLAYGGENIYCTNLDIQAKNPTGAAKKHRRKFPIQVELQLKEHFALAGHPCGYVLCVL